MVQEPFESAVQEVKKLTQRPTNEELLQLYALFKQATEGDVKGSRPGLLDLKGRAKYDAWAKLKGKSVELSRTEYVSLVATLKKKYS